MAEEPPSEIPLESAKEINNNQKINFPEFEKYEIFEGKFKVEKDPGKLVHAFRYIGKGLGNMKTFLEEHEIKAKLKTGGTATLSGISKAGNFLYGKTKEGLGYLYKKISGENENKDNEEDEKIILERETNNSNIIEKDDNIILNEDDILELLKCKDDATTCFDKDSAFKVTFDTNSLGWLSNNLTGDAGYWTAIAIKGSNLYAWSIKNGSITPTLISDSTNIGIRPVIVVSKDSTYLRRG